jgi:hypothetical protein
VSVKNCCELCLIFCKFVYQEVEDKRFTIFLLNRISMTGETEGSVNTGHSLLPTGDKLINFVDNRSCSKPAKRSSLLWWCLA